MICAKRFMTTDLKSLVPLKRVLPPPSLLARSLHTRAVLGVQHAKASHTAEWHVALDCSLLTCFLYIAEQGYPKCTH
jgi:hypothetical protein